MLPRFYGNQVQSRKKGILLMRNLLHWTLNAITQFSLTDSSRLMTMMINVLLNPSPHTHTETHKQLYDI